MNENSEKRSKISEALWIGAGNMGLPMASNLISSNKIRLSVHNRTPGRLAPLEKAGARRSDDLSRSLSETTLVFTMLADDAAVSDVAERPGGILDKLPAGGIHVCMGTLSPTFVDMLSEKHQKKGQILVSAPVFGRPDRAKAGTLTIIAAGPTAALDSVEPLLKTMGSPVFRVGETPSRANTIKILGNFTLGGLLETLAESLTLARKVGVSPSQLVEILDTALYHSPVFRNYGQIMAEEKFEPAGFWMRLGLKDVRMVLREADKLDVPLPLGDILHAGFLAGIHRGYGEWDWAALGRVRDDDAGVSRKS